MQQVHYTAIVFQEICNAYTELNDPFVQRAQFEKQVINKQMSIVR